MLSSRWHQSDHLGIREQEFQKVTLYCLDRITPARVIVTIVHLDQYQTREQTCDHIIRKHSWSIILKEMIPNACRMFMHHRLQVTDVALFFHSWKRKTFVWCKDEFSDTLNKNCIRRGKAQKRIVGGAHQHSIFCVSQNSVDRRARRRAFYSFSWIESLEHITQCLEGGQEVESKVFGEGCPIWDHGQEELGIETRKTTMNSLRVYLNRSQSKLLKRVKWYWAWSIPNHRSKSFQIHAIDSLHLSP